MTAPALAISSPPTPSLILTQHFLLKLLIPISDAIFIIQFAPNSNNLLISSWDSNLRLCNLDASVDRLEANSEAALLDCCFSEDDSVSFSVASV
ncbi:mitotic checkpoint protein BUB3, putative [Medicago truncatula]|uniref:Mitotic checkpoint protein BUB3, putative n=1 Tax=Medicago truncatula TaxID=3880 RepID=G7L6A5_MEDTR|nr:mitotic checkpoint protein BUB3, putative [Medicago truncatula]